MDVPGKKRFEVGVYQAFESSHVGELRQLIQDTANNKPGSNLSRAPALAALISAEATSHLGQVLHRFASAQEQSTKDLSEAIDRLKKAADDSATAAGIHAKQLTRATGLIGFATLALFLATCALAWVTWELVKAERTSGHLPTATETETK